ncbi:hypothetical protein NXW13_00785 [Bacteroides thetaiotaomicron]|nr:hypothetical protein [Bacteroides thetaiotaomicron]
MKTTNALLILHRVSFPGIGKPTTIEDNELTSDDECVPMDFAPNDILSPQYLADYVHRYSYLKTSPLIMMMKIRKKKRLYPSCLLLHPHRIVNILSGSVLPYTEGEEVVLKVNKVNIHDITFVSI